MDLGNQCSFIRWNTKPRTQPPRSERALERLHKLVHSFSRTRGDRDTRRKTFQVRLRQLAARQIIDLVENDQRLLAVSVKFFDRRIDRVHLLVPARMTQIDNMNEQIGLADLFERGLE